MLLQLLKYNLWANKKIVAFILDAGETVADLEQVSSFNSVRKTLYHMWDAQELWFKRLHGESPNTWPSKNFSGDLFKACELFIQSSEHFVNWFNEQQNSESNIIEYANLKGDKFSNTVSEIITHVVNHGTFHRGQLITMLRVAGYTNLSSTDMITYYRESAA